MNYLSDAYQRLSGQQEQQPEGVDIVTSVVKHPAVASVIKHPAVAAGAVAVAEHPAVAAGAVAVAARSPKYLAIGAITALFLAFLGQCATVTPFKPLGERFISVMQPILDHTPTIVEIVAFLGLLFFDETANIASFGVGIGIGVICLSMLCPPAT